MDTQSNSVALRKEFFIFKNQLFMWTIRSFFNFHRNTMNKLFFAYLEWSSDRLLSINFPQLEIRCLSIQLKLVQGHMPLIKLFVTLSLQKVVTTLFPHRWKKGGLLKFGLVLSVVVVWLNRNLGREHGIISVHMIVVSLRRLFATEFHI